MHPFPSPWSSGIVIGVFVAFGALVVILVVYEWKFAGTSSILPLRFFKNRTQVGACLEAFFLMFTLLLATYYLPIFLYVFVLLLLPTPLEYQLTMFLWCE